MLLKFPEAVNLHGLKPGDEIRLVCPMGRAPDGQEWGATVQHAGPNVVDKVTRSHVHVLVDGTYRVRYDRASGRSSQGGVCLPLAVCLEARRKFLDGERYLLGGGTLFNGSGEA